VSLRLVVGLGNPGSEYAKTRHNVGFMLLDEKFAKSANWQGWKEWKGLGQYGTTVLGNGEKCFCVRPLTFMNESGRMVQNFASFHKIPPKDILVCFDDWALPLAKLRLKPQGSSGGHNGMQSIIDHLGTQDIPRLRIGIGPLPPGRDSAQFVLSNFAKNEHDALVRALDRAFSAAYDLAAYEMEFAMNKYNAPETVGEDN
jgi:PTH1 family peptidyl-tRNA hydrolase